MAVQRKHTTRSKRGMRRAHNALTGKELATDSFTGETHLRHHMTAEGYYRGKPINVKEVAEEQEESTTEE